MPIIPEALFALLETQDGPVGLEVTKKAEEVRGYARGYVERIMHRLPDPSIVSQSVNYEQTGTEAVVGIDDHGIDSIEDYLANKEAFELTWLFPAVQDAFPATD